MCQPIHSVLTILIISLLSFQTIAQTTCKPQWDRRTAYQLTVKDVIVEARTWADRSDASRTITQRGDTIIVSRGERTLTTFRTSGPLVISPQVVMKDDSGTIIWIDSFQVSGRNHDTQEYLDSFWGKQTSRWRYYANGMPSGVAYKDWYGEDTLVIEWAQTGIIKYKKHQRREYRYSETGVLLSETMSGFQAYKKTYYDHGVLKQFSLDTLVKNQFVQFIRDYSAAGVLRMESWLKDGMPCETWREYNEAGALVKTIKHKPLMPGVPVELAVGVEEAWPIAEYIDERAEFAGGETAFKQKIENEMVSVFCSGGVPLEGNYIIRFEIREDGAVRFLDAKGSNVESIRPALKTFMEKLPRWKSGRHSGRHITEIKTLTVRFSEV